MFSESDITLETLKSDVGSKLPSTSAHGTFGLRLSPDCITGLTDIPDPSLRSNTITLYDHSWRVGTRTNASGCIFSHGGVVEFCG